MSNAWSMFKSFAQMAPGSNAYTEPSPWGCDPDGVVAIEACPFLPWHKMREMCWREPNLQDKTRRPG
jgi:hypothetical protein